MEERNEIPSVPQAGRSLGREITELLKVLIISFAVVFAIRSWVAQPFLVRGASMEPNFEDRDYLIVDELTYRLREPERGEPIVFRYPKDQRQFFIKRIIGLPGERVHIQQGKVRVLNSRHPEGVTLTESYLDPPGRSTSPDLTVALRAGEYFVLGDNRDFSSDSRIWGSLERDFIVGRVLVRAWPFTRLAWFPISFVSSDP